MSTPSQADSALADALVAARAAIDGGGGYGRAYGPYLEDMIVAYATCSLKFPFRSKEWEAELETHDVIHRYRAWCWDKAGNISKGW